MQSEQRRRMLMQCKRGVPAGSRVLYARPRGAGRWAGLGGRGCCAATATFARPASQLRHSP